MSETPNLAEAGVIAKLNIRLWSGRCADKPAGRETAARNKADSRMVRVSKSLIPLEALEPIKKLAGEIRTYHYENTLVWTDGAQFLPSRLSIPYSTAMQDFRLRYDGRASEFCSLYFDLVEKARGLLGDLFYPEDYPSVRSMRELFSVDVSYEPLPDSSHFLTQVAAATLSEFRRDLERKNELREQAMRRDLWERLRAPVVKMAEALSDPDRIFRDTLVGNVAEIANRLDSLNVFNDPEMTSVAATLRDTLAPLDPEQLRRSAEDRSEAAHIARSVADRIATNMQGFMLGLEAAA